MSLNSLQPPLNEEEREVVKASGDWQNFVQSYGLKAYDPEENREAEQIVAALAERPKAEPEEAARAPEDERAVLHEAPVSSSRLYDDLPPTPVTAGSDTDLFLGYELADAIEEGLVTESADDLAEASFDASVPDEDDEAAYAISDDESDVEEEDWH